MKPYHFLAAFASVLLAGCTSAPTEIEPGATLEENVSHLRHKYGVPAVAYAVIRDGETVAIGAQGRVRNGRLRTVNLDSAFQISSNTKAITSLLAGIAVDRGEVRWDTTVAESLRPAGYDIPDQYADLTLEQLLSHTAGVPPMVDIDTWSAYLASDESTPAQRRRMITDIMKLPPGFPAGSAYEYSNMGYVIAGAMLEGVCGASWEQLVTERIFAPLGMQSGGFGPPAVSGERSQPWGHNPGSVAPDAIGSDGPPGGAPAGAVHANITDLVRYVRVWLDEGAPLISTGTYQEIITPRRNQYGLGWGSFMNEYGRVLTHDGCNTMFYSTMYLMPDSDSAVIIVANDGSEGGQALLHELWVYLMQTLLGA